VIGAYVVVVVVVVTTLSTIGLRRKNSQDGQLTSWCLQRGRGGELVGGRTPLWQTTKERNLDFDSPWNKGRGWRVTRDALSR